MTEITLPNILGLLGAAAIVAAYLLLQLGRLKVESASYSVLNIIGTILVLFSLLFEFNLPAFLLQIVWLAISIIGLSRAIMSRAS